MNNHFDCFAVYYRNDITFKLNKKKSGSIVEQAPTFKNASVIYFERRNYNKRTF
jgi:hypothetical protein